MQDPVRTAKRIGPALPNERDETPHVPPPPGKKMKQAAADVAAGKVDTEARGDSLCNFDPAACKPPKVPRAH